MTSAVPWSLARCYLTVRVLVGIALCLCPIGPFQVCMVKLLMNTYICAEDSITASQVPSSQAAAILDSDAASSQPQPKPSVTASDAQRQTTSQQQETSQTAASQQPQQSAEHAKPSTSGTDAAPVKQQAAVAVQQDAQQKPQASKPAERQPAAAAAPKAGGAWGGTKSFRDIAAGNKPDKVRQDC